MVNAPGSLLTQRWREVDSNHRFPATVSFVKPRYHLLFAGTGADVASSSRWGRRAIASAKAGCGFLKVRTFAIHPHIQL
jgi:hypothetical protein